MELRRVVTLLQEPAAPFEIGVAHEVFGVDRRSDGVPAFEFTTASCDPARPLRVGAALRLQAEHDLSALRTADLVVVPSGPVPAGADPLLLDALSSAHDRGAILLGTCTGVFTLAETGVLDGRTAAVHWRHAEQFAQSFENVAVDRAALYRASEHGVVTCAGTAAGIDACLHLVREAHGALVANRIARRMVSPPHRSGGQLQYLEHPLPQHTDETFHLLMAWIEDSLDQPISLTVLARQAHVSTRTLTRRFRERTGASPLSWVTSRRINRAQQLLESTDLTLHEIARRTGFTTTDLMRHHFRIATETTPSEYRRRFRGALDEEAVEVTEGN